MSPTTDLHQGRSALQGMMAVLISLTGLPLVKGAEPASMKNAEAPVLTRAQMESDLDYLTMRVKRALLGVDIDASGREEPSRVQLLPEKGVERYQGKLAVLMDEGCFSACDCFLNYLAIAAPKTLFVGRPNGAGAGAPRPAVALPYSKMVITFCVMQVWNLNGQLIESRPLRPTLPVEWTSEDLRQGRDPDLEAALKSLEGEEASRGRS